MKKWALAFKCVVSSIMSFFSLYVTCAELVQVTPPSKLPLPFVIPVGTNPFKFLPAQMHEQIIWTVLEQIPLKDLSIAVRCCLQIPQLRRLLNKQEFVETVFENWKHLPHDIIPTRVSVALYCQSFQPLNLSGAPFFWMDQSNKLFYRLLFEEFMKRCQKNVDFFTSLDIFFEAKKTPLLTFACKFRLLEAVDFLLRNKKPVTEKAVATAIYPVTSDSPAILLRLVAHGAGVDQAIQWYQKFSKDLSLLIFQSNNPASLPVLRLLLQHTHDSSFVYNDMVKTEILVHKHDDRSQVDQQLFAAKVNLLENRDRS